jgi:sulfofructose kinase
VTRGAQGMMWLDEAGRIQVMPTFPVHTVDTLGAGDVFHGAFAWGLLAGLDAPALLRAANAAAALACTERGAQGALPDRARLETFLAAYSSS